VTLAKGGDLPGARKQISEFLETLCNTIILDPACGTANFLYVAMEHMKRLEGEVWDMLRGLGESQAVFEGTGHAVDPHQFLGIEINPRAAAIAELVLWIGYLQWHFRTFGAKMPAEPIIKPFHNIECRDAVLEYDRKEPVLDAQCKPITRWNGRTFKKHPVTGDDVPDEEAKTPVFRYINPKAAEWPKADYITGNPPYLGVRTIKAALGIDYVETLRRAYGEIPETCDYVMYWWHKAASAVSRGSASRFGFITTNSILQEYSNVLIAQHIQRDNGIEIIYAIAQHPWVESTDGAAVDVSMTVGLAKSAFPGFGRIGKVVKHTEKGLDDTTVTESRGPKIGCSLEFDLAGQPEQPLQSNRGMCFQGVVPAGDGFKLTEAELVELGLSADSLPEVVKKYIIGKDLVQMGQGRYIVDFFGLSEREARQNWPALFQRLLDRVYPERVHNNRQAYRQRWWIFAEPRPAMRRALAGLRRFIVTPYTAKYRPFTFVGASTLPDAMAYAVASEDAFHLGVLSSRVHRVWALHSGGTLEDRPRYNSNKTFAPFAFPSGPEQSVARIREAAESLDSHRKRRQTTHPSVTLTAIYNVLEKLRSGEPLTNKDKVMHEQGLVSVLKQLHDELDAAVFDAYGWPHDLSDDEILRRLVELNQERAEEEKRGVIRWLRPEYQNSEGTKAAVATQGALPIGPEDAESQADKAGKRPWPRTLPEQAQAVRAVLAEHTSGLTPEQLARLFLRANTKLVSELLQTLVSLGQARALEGGGYVRT